MTDTAAARWPPGQEEMARRIREHDWRATPLGPIEGWPRSLKSVVNLLLRSGFPMVALWGPELTQLYNDGYRDIMGLKHPAGLGQATRACWPEVWHINAPIYARVLQGETLKFDDALYPITRHGTLEEAWFTLAYSPLSGDDESIAGVLVTVIETTEKQRTQLALRRSEERFRALVEPFAQAVWEADAGGRIVEDSPSWRAYTGQTLEEWLGEGWAQAVHPEEREDVLRQWREAVRTGSPVNAEFRLRSPGGWRWTNSRAAPLRDADGSVRRWVGMNVDVTDRRQTEEALRQSEVRFRTLFDTMDEGFAVCECVRDGGGRVVDYRFLELNPAVEALTGISMKAARGRRAREVVPGIEEWWSHTFGRVVDTGESTRFEHYSRLFGRWFDITAFPYGDDRFAILYDDITARKRAEEALRDREEQLERLLAAATAAQAKAEEANRAKDEFLATLSHELRTPLAPILLWGRALRSGSVPRDELGRALEAIVLSAESQSRLIEDLLDLSRLKAGKLLLAPRGTAVEDVARAAMEVIRPMAEAKHQTLVLEVQPRLGPAVLDPGRFQQVLWNLLSNAVKFTPASGRISLRVWQDAGQLHAEVADTGQGISADFLPHLFQRFHQEDTGDARQHMGLGIGLALCRHLVELHGGSIEARSEGPGRGAVFSVRIPWVDGAAETRGEGRGTGSEAGASRPLAGRTVLLVEDDPSTRDVMRWTLERAGASVFTSGSGAEALGVLDTLEEQRRAPDAIVCDIGLPGMSGYALIEAIQARGKKPIPACAVSAHAREVDRRRAIQAGFELFIAKPSTAEALIGAVEELVATAGAG